MGTNCFLSQCKRSLNSTTNRKFQWGTMFKSTTKTLQQRVWTLLRSLFLAWIGSAMLFSKVTTTFTRHWSKFQPKIVSLFLTFGTFLFFLHCCHMSLPACSTSSVEWSYFLWGWSHFNDMLDYIIIQNLWHLFPVLKGLQKSNSLDWVT